MRTLLLRAVGFVLFATSLGSAASLASAQDVIPLYQGTPPGSAAENYPEKEYFSKIWNTGVVTNVTKPTPGNAATLFSAEQYDSCPQAVMGLSYDWTSMKSLVSNMKPAGSTNQAIGLQLGWMSLFGGGPFTMPAEDPNYTYQHVIILLTDGLNTEDRWYTDQSSIDARQAMTCANAKAAGVTLYMIQVNTDGSPTSTLLQNCATDSSK